MDVALIAKKRVTLQRNVPKEEGMRVPPDLVPDRKTIKKTTKRTTKKNPADRDPKRIPRVPINLRRKK